jgi:hypothetical protein
MARGLYSTHHQSLTSLMKGRHHTLDMHGWAAAADMMIGRV